MDRLDLHAGISRKTIRGFVDGLNLLVFVVEMGETLSPPQTRGCGNGMPLLEQYRAFFQVVVKASRQLADIFSRIELTTRSSVTVCLDRLD